MCSAFENNRREEERGLLITIERVPYFRDAARKRNKCVPLSKRISERRNADCRLQSNAFLIFVMQAAGGTRLFRFRKELARKGTRTADYNRTRSSFSQCRPQEEQMCSAFENNRRKRNADC